MTIGWRNQFHRVLDEARKQHMPVLLDFSAPGSEGCARLDAEVYRDARVARFVDDNFLPSRVSSGDQAEYFRRLAARYGAQWSPTLLMLDECGIERHRIEGFLPAEDFLAELEMGLSRIVFFDGRYPEAAGRFHDIAARYPDGDVAPEALYWAGVARFKATDDARALRETARSLQRRYQQSPWAKRASVWAA